MAQATALCKKCDGLNYVVEGGKRLACICVVKRKIRLYLGTFGQIACPSSGAVDVLKGLDPNQNLYLLGTESDMSRIYGALSMLLVHSGQFKSFRVMNVYELIEVFLGKLDFADSVFKLNERILILLNGFHEMENRRQEDLILQTLENRRRMGTFTWFYNRGRTNPLKAVDTYLRGNKFKVVELDGKRSIDSARLI